VDFSRILVLHTFGGAEAAARVQNPRETVGVVTIRKRFLVVGLSQPPGRSPK